jgi:hypothetical protein
MGKRLESTIGGLRTGGHGYELRRQGMLGPRGEVTETRAPPRPRSLLGGTQGVLRVADAAG